MNKTEKNIGKWFEQNIVAPAFKLLARRQNMYYHRYLDMHAAGSHVPAAPADFECLLRGLPILVECKASINNLSLVNCLADMVEDHQCGSHRLWIAARGVSMFLFYSDQTRLVEFWSGMDVITARAHGRPLAPADKFGICKAEELGAYFNTRMSVLKGS